MSPNPLTPITLVIPYIFFIHSLVITLLFSTYALPYPIGLILDLSHTFVLIPRNL